MFISLRLLKTDWITYCCAFIYDDLLNSELISQIVLKSSCLHCDGDMKIQKPLTIVSRDFVHYEAQSHYVKR